MEVRAGQIKELSVVCGEINNEAQRLLRGNNGQGHAWGARRRIRT